MLLWAPLPVSSLRHRGPQATLHWQRQAVVPCTEQYLHVALLRPALGGDSQQGWAVQGHPAPRSQCLCPSLLFPWPFQLED